MISAGRAKREARRRDVGRSRVVLAIGEMTYHLSEDEARRLARDLERVTRRERRARCEKR